MDKGEEEGELRTKQNPDFINMGLLIWAWAILHLSQQEQHTKQAAKTHLEAQPRTHRHIHIHMKTQDNITDTQIDTALQIRIY